MNCLEKFGMHLANTVCFINLLPWLYGNRSISHSVRKIYKGNQEGRGLLWRQTERAGNNPVWEGNARSFRLIWGLAESTKQAEYLLCTQETRIQTLALSFPVPHGPQTPLGVLPPSTELRVPMSVALKPEQKVEPTLALMSWLLSNGMGSTRDQIFVSAHSRNHFAL